MTAPQADRIAKALERLADAQERTADSLEHQELQWYMEDRERRANSEQVHNYFKLLREPIVPDKVPFWRRWLT